MESVMSLNKRVMPLFLIAVLTFPVAGTYGWLKMQMRQVRREVKRKIMQGISRDNLVRWEFTKDTAETLLHWKDNNEFEYKGRMYDVVFREETARYVILWCWPDDEETMLNQQLSHLVTQLLGQSYRGRTTMKQPEHFFSDFFLTQGMLYIALLGVYDIRPILVLFPSVLVEHVPPSPPPELR
ncbi:MAG: hypothetical protein KatS3mg031_0026 [Chitinophagales bacterium]|nr:MAG: hypothetical protein KatS3mg031_0026 [Chitinophagales bacterium]